MAGGVDRSSTARLPDERRPGVRTDTAPLRAVLLHRPGRELSRAVSDCDALPPIDASLLEDAQRAHDDFADLLGDRGVAVYSLRELLVETIEVSGAARIQGIAAAVSARRLGPALAAELSGHLRGRPPRDLVEILTAGMTFDSLATYGVEELDVASLVRQMYRGTDFVIEPLPNLLFMRDSSFWIGDRFAISSLASVARERESSLADLIYAHHPMFSGSRRAYGSQIVPIEGRDVVLLAPGVIALGVSERTTPAGAESLARSLFGDDLAHTVLAVPIDRQVERLDSLLTMVDTDAVLVNSLVRESLIAYAMRPSEDGGVRVDASRAFLAAAADAMGIDTLRVIDTQPTSVEAGNDLLALAPGIVVAPSRAVEMNSRLAEGGIEVLAIDVGELVFRRGGLRGLACSLIRQF
ncbi:arginine deiminase [Gordonia effusa NBRC 100432]|uniref:Arginine deiminase n=1 Tax=Gordonia effusa NBRC 100432 TaxID=1077974 RepID=H0QUR1_9ACTN|nr:arginine deiminase family protein [Gordonia effusa]GAB16562.1 arginine deiminase [Gordonia effusa NBRC 100432]